MAATGPNGGFAEAAGVFVIFAALILPLQLELSFARVNWDEANIYARSPWRPLRIIPFHAVRSCDYSEFWKWYRIHTEGYGTIRIQFFAVGIPNLFAVLPCPTPPYPPAVIG